jgi:hypothetical protein
VIGVVIAVVIVGVVLVLAGVVFLLRCAFEVWEDDQRQRDTEIANQVAALRAALQVELAGRHALLRLSHLDGHTDAWLS